MDKKPPIPTLNNKLFKEMIDKFEATRKKYFVSNNASEEKPKGVFKTFLSKIFKK